MKFYVCTLLASMAITLPAFAAPQPAEEVQEDHGTMVVTMVEQNLFNPLAMPASCTAVALTDAQKASLQDAYFAFAKQHNTLSAEIKNAWLDVRHTFMSKDSTKDQGTASLTAAKTAMSSLGDAMGTLSTSVFYDILTPVQRAPAWTCMTDLAKMKKQKMLREICAKLPPATTPAPTPTPTPTPAP